MSQHKSLKNAGKMGKVRNVLKRYERLNLLKGQGKEIKSVYNLPKVKLAKVKFKKIKDAKEEKTDELTPNDTRV